MIRFSKMKFFPFLMRSMIKYRGNLELNIKPLPEIHSEYPVEIEKFQNYFSNKLNLQSPEEQKNEMEEESLANIEKNYEGYTFNF